MGVSERLRRAAVVAGLAYAAAAPFVWYLSRVAYPERIQQRFPRSSTEQLLGADMIMIAFLVVISAVIGSFLSERNGLRGLGDLASLRAAAPIAAGGGLLLSALIYLAVGRRIAVQAP